MAKEKLNTLNVLENGKKKEEEKEAPLEIEFSSGEVKNDKLFEPDSVSNKPVKVEEVNDEK